jgi:predicted metal-binding protein
MRELDLYVKKAKSMGVSRAKIIDAKNVVVGNRVRLKCVYGCDNYGRWLTCPPHTPTPDYTREMLGEYSKGLLMQIENISFTEQKEIGVKFSAIVTNLEREIFLDGYYKVLGMVSGTCKLCRICDTMKTCKHPYEARPSIEACGIDVYQTARNSGFTLEVVKSKDSLFSRVGLLLIE